MKAFFVGSFIFGKTVQIQSGTLIFRRRLTILQLSAALAWSHQIGRHLLLVPSPV